MQDGTTGLGGGHLPLAMDLDNPQIVSALRSGVLLCDLINAVAPNTVDTRVVNTAAVPGVIEPGSELSAATENLQLALSAAQSIGCVIGAITAADIEAGSAMKAMDIVWQVSFCSVQSELSWNH